MPKKHNMKPMKAIETAVCYELSFSAENSLTLPIVSLLNEHIESMGDASLREIKLSARIHMATIQFEMPLALRPCLETEMKTNFVNFLRKSLLDHNILCDSIKRLNTTHTVLVTPVEETDDDR